MPDTVSRIEMGTSSGFETAATMLGGSTALGYIVVGLLAFVLGVCVTVLCFRIRRLNEEEQTVRLSPHDTLTERNAEAESKKYFVLLLSF